jgi:2-polyprenyl-6-methoxyphenol hydroxylase-like FAD-dependent oxidoreductase
MSAEKSKPRALVIGGSLGGLMAGIESLHAGCDVEIFERSPRALDDRGAGIVMQSETLHMLTHRCGLAEDETGVRLRQRQYLGHDGKPESQQYMPQLTTSWGLLQRALRETFPEERYHAGCELLEFTDAGGAVSARFADGSEVRGNLLIGADGSRSTIRQQLFPEVQPRYAGYVAWRGVVHERVAGAPLLSTFGDYFTFQQMHHSHILCYLIPGANGETQPGERRLNWVWYWNFSETELPRLMTGHDNRLHKYSIPPGHLCHEVVTAQQDIASRVLCPQFFELWQATQEPFLQPILDLGVPRMVSGRVALVGDAAFIPRPHTAASTSKAAANAIALGEAVGAHPSDLERALAEWEPDQLALGRRLEAHGQMLGNRSQFS